MKLRDSIIESAISDYQAGIYTSIRATARAYGLSFTTLRDRLAGASNAEKSHVFQQRLSPEQEKQLVEWILKETSRGCVLTRPRVREMAESVLNENGDAQPIGKAWVTGFLRRNPRVASCVGKKKKKKVEVTL